jgi:hypothetical protein
MKVYLKSNILSILTCFSTSNEQEEVAALLLGTWSSGNGKVREQFEELGLETNAATIEKVFILARKEKKKDRVEIDAHVLSLALTKAEDQVSDRLLYIALNHVNSYSGSLCDWLGALAPSHHHPSLTRRSFHATKFSANGQQVYRNNLW